MPHSPTPYEAISEKDADDRRLYFTVVDANGKVIVDTLNSEVAVIEEDSDEDGVHRWDEQGRQDTEFIAKACNVHADLVAACEAWIAWAEHLDAISSPDDPMRKVRSEMHKKRLDACRAAVAKAKGRRA